MNKILNFKGAYRGLDSLSADSNLKTYGYNSEVKHEEKRKIKFYAVFKSLRIYLMLVAVVLYFSDERIMTGGLMLLLTLGYCAFEIIAENHCAEKINELTASDKTAVIIRVVRDGRVVTIRREELVQDDLIILQGGENVPADAHILESSNVTVDESAFGRSSSPVEKHPGSDDRHELKKSCVYKGTKVLSGILIARVFAIGQDVKIRPEIRTAKEFHRTHFEAALGKLSVLFTYGAAIALVVAAVARFITAGNAKLDENATALSYLAEISLPAISFALCVIPISLILFVRFYYIRGATELSAKYGNIKSLQVMETLNDVTTACIDINSVIVPDSITIVEENSKNNDMLIRIAMLSCQNNSSAVANPYEKAIYINAAFKHMNIKELHKNTLIKSYIPEKAADYNKINGNLWDINGARLLCIKGEPESVLSFCNLPPEQLYPIQQKQSELTKQGHKVLAVAFAKIKSNEELEDGENAEDESPPAPEIPNTLFDASYTFLGLIAFSSAIREDIPAAVQSCHRAGVNVVMVSPDADRAGGNETALAVARKAGIREEGVLSGNKADIVESLKAAGETVAVFGKSGVDTRALELSDIGIALSKHTTGDEWDSCSGALSELTSGSAFEACDFVLAQENDNDENNSLHKFIGAFVESRQVHRNIKRAFSVVASVFSAVFLFGLLNLLMGGEFVPDAIVITIISTIFIPLFSLFFIRNKQGKSSWAEPPVFDPDGKINPHVLIKSAIQGVSLFLVMLVMFLIFRSIEGGEEGVQGFSAGMLRAIFLTVFISGGSAMLWVNSSRTKPFYSVLTESFSQKKTKHGEQGFFDKISAEIFLTAILFIFLLLLVYLPHFNSAFGFDSINPLFFILALIAGGVSQIWFDIIKRRF
ncbi:MAG: cation-translocating P-type ATPase [Oscillospiraceae bacterium]|nr:cation-translocating P-type ATPase [Oscillospiraceae bacterium]